MNEADSADNLYRALRRHIAAGDLTIRCDFRRLRHMDSPVAVEAESTRWAYAVVAATLFALWRLGWTAALAVAAAGVALYYTAGSAHVRRNIRRRIEARSLTSLDDWQRLWRFGGVALVMREGRTCEAPQGNWMALVRELRP